MSRIFNPVLYYCVVIPISVLPFPLLYILSRFAYFLAYYVVGYRKKVVRENLEKSFPEKSKEELKKIEKKFYRHFGDFILEMIKSLTVSEKEILKRCTITNPEVPQKFYDKGKSVIVMCGHYNNWEYYAKALEQQVPHQTMAAYMPLNDTFFNNKLLKSRQKFGLKMHSMKNLMRFFTNSKNELTLSVLLNDQAPANPQKAYWNTFLNQETPWLIGPEKIAKKYDIPVLFGCIRKSKRGHYKVTFEIISENPTQEKEGAITEKHTQLMEKIIKEAPEYWLWSHRRWKHKKESV